MIQHLTVMIVLMSTLLASCSSSEHDAADKSSPSDKVEVTAPPKEVQYKMLDWSDLMPKQEPSPKDLVGTNEEGDLNIPLAEMVVSGLNGQHVKVPGFIVPIEFKEEQVTTQFFLVPYFGACIHVPPPPPNQVVFVNYPKGLKLNSLYDPYWISGTMKTQLTENDVATSAYVIEADAFELYQY